MKIADFLVNLSLDPEALAAFRRDREAAMAAADLPEEDRQRVRDGTLGDIPELTIAQSMISGFHKDRRWELQREIEPGPQARPLDNKGLTVVGLGIRSLQTTLEARVCIAQASKVLHLLADPISEGFVRKLNATAESLQSFYEVGKLRSDVYDAMVEKILSDLDRYGDVCVVFYGHPAVLCDPAHESLRRARKKGISGRMLPGISTLDNLTADLPVDSAALQSYEATAFLACKYRFDTSAALVLWQLGVLGESVWNPPHPAVAGRLKVLSDYLSDFYGRDHQVFLYRAATIPTDPAMVERMALGDLAEARDVASSTLYVPPKEPPKLDPDMVKKLGME